MFMEDQTTELVVVDVSKYKKIKRALRESEERFRILFENIPLGVFRATLDGNILDANPAFIKMLGYDSFDNLQTRNLSQIFQNQSFPWERMRTHLERYREMKGMEIRCCRQDGSGFFIRLNATVLYDQNGKVLYIEGTIEDITEKKVMEHLAEKRSKELEILNRIIFSGNKATQLQQLLEVTADHVVTLMNFDMSCIYLIQPENKRAVLQVCRGLPEKIVRKIETYPLDTPVYRDFFLQGKPLFTNDAFDRLMGKAVSAEMGWACMATIPLLAGEKLIGSLHVTSNQQQEFSSDEKTLLELIGREVGVLISKLLAESAVRESEKFYRQLVETSPDIIGRLSLNNSIQMINQQFLKTCGYSQEDELLGISFLDFLLPDEHERFLQCRQDLLDVGRINNMEFTVVDKKKHLTPIDINASIVSDDEGKPKGIIIFGRDITARKLAENILKENEQIFRRTFEAIPDPAYVWLRMHAGKIVLHLANTAARLLSQNRIQDYLGMELDDIYIDHPEIVSRVKEVFASGKTVNEIIHFKEQPTKEERWLLCDYVKTAENNILWITKDITERKLSEEKVLNYQEQLRSLTSALSLTEERERRKIAGSLHDHIGQQLAFCKIKLETLGNILSDEQAIKSFLEIRDLLDQAISDTRSLIFELSPPILYELGFDVAIEWLVEHIQKRYELAMTIKAESKGGQLEENIQILLFQIARELLINVAKHSKAQNARIIVKREKGYIQIEVIDDGQGFDAQNFFSRKSVSEFGFFSIRERLKHLGGVLKVESKSGLGTRVFLKVPLEYNIKV